MTIVKVQAPVYTNDPNMPWLVYDQYRARECQIPDKNIPKPIKAFMGTDKKAFFTDAKWLPKAQTWDLTIAVITHWRTW